MAKEGGVWHERSDEDECKDWSSPRWYTARTDATLELV